MGLTTDRHDGCLHEIDPDTGLQQCYLILPDGERQNLVRPVRRSYVHTKCGVVTWMAQAIAETYSVNPSFYSATYCVGCKTHLPVGQAGDFYWDGTNEKVGT